MVKESCAWSERSWHFISLKYGDSLFIRLRYYKYTKCKVFGFNLGGRAGKNMSNPERSFINRFLACNFWFKCYTTANCICFSKNTFI